MATSRSALPNPDVDFLLTHFIVVSDQDRAREWYLAVLGGEVAHERNPVMLRVANGWIIMNSGGGPTDDKPDVELVVPTDPRHVSAFLNIRVADIAAFQQRVTAAGEAFLTDPKDHGHEIRAFLRHPDGHLIEVGQPTGMREW